MTARSLLLRLASLGTALVCTCLLIFGGVVVGVLQGQGGNVELPVDCAVVFGATVHSVYDSHGNAIDVQAGPGILRRVQKAAELYHRGQVRTLFLTGGKAEDRKRSEAAVMKDVAVHARVPESSIVLEDRATNTWENLHFVRPLTSKCRSVVGISDAYHLARIRLQARKQGWENFQVLPADSPRADMFWAMSVAREALGMVWYGFFY